MIRLYLKFLHETAPETYYYLKNAAITRHKMFNIIIEKSDGNIDRTWHINVIDYFYPF